MKFGSVCSGIEAASVAWHPLGWSAAWLSEIEKFPCSVLAHHYPDVPNLGDMTKVAAMVRAGAVAAPDVLVGGTPCQAFSIAGLRASMDDARGQLTLSFVDIANAIDSARIIRGEQPCIVVWENVPGVLSTADNAFGCFLGALAGEDGPIVPPGKKWSNAGCVFGPQRAIAWRVMDAQYVGVAQRRRRVFVVASARDGFDPSQIIFEFDGLRRDTPPSREAGQEITGTIGSRTTGGGGFGADFECSGGLQPVLSVALRGRDGGATAELGDEVAGCLRASGGGDKAHVLAPICFDTTQISSPHNGSNPKPSGSCHTLSKGGHAPAIAFDARQDCVSSTEVFGALGSSSPQAQAVCMRESGHGYWMQDDIAGTLRAEGENRESRPSHVIKQQKMAVRRLTPTERERLQGFEDNYTMVLHRGKPAADGNRYKALGNSMAVTVMAWIGQRIQGVITNLNQPGD